ncbi:hypothetical protein GCM10023195_71820 [Actinoallomurus liliacearum]|uniref:Membrane transport protein MMPL domain-containing protein n=1 Tax=Actinoallomurus liliacearum TaxID=1080073 RepID=A0ABP8TYM1_9ACTN
MFAALGRFAAARRRWVVAAALVFAVFAGVWGTGVFGAFTGGAGFDPPAAESSRADRILAGPLGRYAADVVVLYEDPARTVDDPAFVPATMRLLGARVWWAPRPLARWWDRHGLREDAGPAAPGRSDPATTPTGAARA